MHTLNTKGYVVRHAEGHAAKFNTLPKFCLKLAWLDIWANRQRDECMTAELGGS